MTETPPTSTEGASAEGARARAGAVDAPFAPAPPSIGRRLARLAPLLLLAGLGLAGAILFGDRLSFETLSANRAALLAWRDANYLGAALAFGGLYALVVALSIPGALWMTLAGGFLFGTWIGAPLIVAAATLGATAVFLAARTGLGDLLRERAGPWLERLRAGFEENAASYMLIMRLVPAVPFFVANLAPAFLGVRASTFVWTTLLGIVPGTLVYTSIGAGLGEIIARGERPDLGLIFDGAVLGPLLGLAALAAAPILFKRRAALRRAAAQ